ncbi:MAG: hypothetical protein ABIQ11_05595 [Saprospiraceae bacterium]
MVHILNLIIRNLNSGKAPLYFGYSFTGMRVNAGTTIHLYDMTFRGDGTSLIQNLGILHLHNITMDATGLLAQPLVNQNQAQVYGVVEIRQ